MVKDYSFSISAKLVAFVSMLICALTAKAGSEIYLFFVIALVYLLIQRRLKYAILFSAFYCIICITWTVMVTFDFDMIILTSFHIYFFWLMMPVFMVSNDLILSPPGQVSAFLSKHRAPTNVILAVLVIFRFFPTIKGEFNAIWQSMHNRGLLVLGQVLRHPVASFEYILVPLLMRIIQISDQLTISALSRGIEAPMQRAAYYYKKTTIRDYGCMVIFLSITMIVVVKEVVL